VKRGGTFTHETCTLDPNRSFGTLFGDPTTYGKYICTTFTYTTTTPSGAQACANAFGSDWAAVSAEGIAGFSDLNDVGNGDAVFLCKLTQYVSSRPPSVTPTITGTAGDNGWYRSAVTVAWTLSDDEGGHVANGCQPTTLSQNTAGTTLTCVATNFAGSTSQSVTIKIDQTAPELLGYATAAYANGAGTYPAGAWSNAPVTVSFLCRDQTGIAANIATNTVAGTTITTETAGQYVTNTGDCIDVAGNRAGPASFGPVNIDMTAPLITGAATTADGQPYVAGAWTNQDVTVAFTCADEGAIQSGVSQPAVGGGATFSAETNGAQAQSYPCYDIAYNLAANALFAPIRIDKTQPVLSASATTADGQVYTAGTWTNQAVTVNVTCADVSGVQSGIASNTAAGATVSSEGANQSVTSSGACVDAAGNAAEPVSFGPIMIDTTAPLVSITAPANATYLLNQPVPVSYSCADPLSDGVTDGAGGGSCVGTVANGANLNTASVGNQTFTVTAVDSLGNTSQPLTVNYVVAYQSALLNVKAGGPWAINIQLQDAAGHNVSAAGVRVTALCVVPHGTPAPTTCGNTPAQTLNSPFQFVNKGPLGAGGGAYSYTIKPKGLAKRTQYDVLVTAAGDPTVHVATFTTPGQ
jgi:hypothetical protein